MGSTFDARLVKEAKCWGCVPALTTWWLNQWLNIEDSQEIERWIISSSALSESDKQCNRLFTIFCGIWLSCSHVVCELPLIFGVLANEESHLDCVSYSTVQNCWLQKCLSGYMHLMFCIDGIFHIRDLVIHVILVIAGQCQVELVPNPINPSCGIHLANFSLHRLFFTLMPLI